jgi:hypothetical protein
VDGPPPVNRKYETSPGLILASAWGNIKI